MRSDTRAFLDQLCDQLRKEFHVHTILLYGSRAHGTEGPHSDFDVAAFGPVECTVRDARHVQGHYLDAFIYPEAELTAPSDKHLPLRGSKILFQQGAVATDFLRELDRIYALGPAALPPHELAARRVWAHKMCARIERGDIEGNFRRVWLLTALLEDYFHLRGRWYEGPKRSFLWLEQHDPYVLSAFEQALDPGARQKAIQELVQAVAGTNNV
jgi:predicted nucleotidyltransferase